MAALPIPLPSTPATVPPAAAPAAGATAGSSAAPALRVRPLGPADEPLLDALHEALGNRSRYQRYHTAKPRLSARERRFLAATDGRDHVALLAQDADGAPVAVARYVRLRDEPGTAEVAAEVVDAHQRRGIASRLLADLAARAAASGVSRFTATVLSETGLRRTLARRGWRVRSFDGPTTTLDVDVWTLLMAAR